jgi:hypothetical protein
VTIWANSIALTPEGAIPLARNRLDARVRARAGRALGPACPFRGVRASARADRAPTSSNDLDQRRSQGSSVRSRRPPDLRRRPSRPRNGRRRIE